MSMRILLVNKYAHVTGGADKHCLDLYRLLTTAGHDVRLLSTVDPLNADIRGAFIGRTVSNADRDGLPVRQRAAVFSKALWNPTAARAMDKVLSDFRPDIVHSHKLYPQLSVTPLIVARRRGLPVIQTLHDYEMISANPFDSTGCWLDRTEARWDYKILNFATMPVRRTLHRGLVTRWIAVSRFLADRHQRGGIEAEVIPHFVDGQLSPVSFNDRSGVAFVGRLSPEKGVSDVLRLASEEPDLDFRLAGDGHLMNHVRQRASGLPNVEVLGQLDSIGVQNLLGRSRVLVVPSHWDEPAGLVALEAMAAGTPVVAYQRGGLAEYVLDAQCGAVVSSPEDFTAQVRRYVTDQRRWSDASVSGLKAAAANYSPERYLLRINDVYRRTLADSLL